MKRKAERIRRNPRGGRVVIGPVVEKIFYRKSDGHGDCDRECKRNGHRFVHTFEEHERFPLIGRPDGKLEI